MVALFTLGTLYIFINMLLFNKVYGKRYAVYALMPLFMLVGAITALLCSATVRISMTYLKLTKGKFFYDAI